MAFLAAAEPAGGAALDQVALATGGATIATAVLMWLVLRHHAGRTTLLTRAAGFAERVGRIPGWAALPAGIAGVALPVALLGMMWDISLHINNGRDEGPLANPAHYLILGGLYGIFVAGVLAMALPREQPCRTSVRIGGWHAPVGGVLMAAAGAFALIGFPLDDVWHRLFGQDVTLWGPTHLMLIGGAGLTLVGQSILLSEGMRHRREQRGDAPATRSGRRVPVVVAFRRAGLMGGLLIGLSTFQGEFDFGVPQFRMIFHPVLIAVAGGMALVAARIWIGRGGALMAVAFFLVVRGAVAIVVGPVLGQTMPSQPLYLVQGIVVELAALALIARPLAFGLVAGGAAGLAGLAAEWPWTQLAFRLPWTTDLLPEAVPQVLVAGAAAGAIGAMFASGLRGQGLPRRAPAILAASLLALGVLIADGLRVDTATDARAVIDRDGAALTVALDPPDLADDAAWLSVTAWQGGGLVVDRMQRTGPGTYRTTKPIPLDGEWKTILRLQDGRSLVGLPIWAPADAAIPAREVAFPAGEPRAFAGELAFMQRERKDAPGWLWGAAGAVVLAIFLAFFALLGWGVGRVARGGPADHGPRRPVLPRTPEAAPA